MKQPVLMDSRPPLVQAVLITVPALVFGVFAGVALDLSAAAYYALLVVALVGGILAGLEHDGGGQGAQRGLTGGLVFGAGVLAGHHLLSRRVTVALPHPESVQLIVSALFGALLGRSAGSSAGRRSTPSARRPPTRSRPAGARRALFASPSGGTRAARGSVRRTPPDALPRIGRRRRSRSIVRRYG